MARLVGLRYTGNKKNGISLVLYRSYKTVTLTPLDPYRFTASDNTSLEAVRYYQRQHNLGIEVILDKELSVHKSAGPVDEGNNHVAKEETPVVIPNDPPNEQKQEAIPAEVTDTPVDIPAQPTADGINLAEFTDNELAEYLDQNFDKAKLYEILLKIEPETTMNKNSRTTTIIRALMSKDKTKVIEAINSVK